MKYNYTPVLVEKGNKKELWRFDFSDLGVTELCEIKEAIVKKAPYSATIVSLDSLIRQKTDQMFSYNKVYGKSYTKVYKENKKEEKLKKRTKTRRR